MGIKMYYKIIHGYDHERQMPIEADELEKAYGLFLIGGRAIFREGAVDSKHIQAIYPDWHRIMGWNKEYKLGAGDYEELSQKGVDVGARELQQKTQERIHYLIDSKQTQLIGKNVKLPELEHPEKEWREGTIKSMKELLASNVS